MNNTRTHSLTFRLTLGPEHASRHPLRHKKDRAREVLVDFSNGEGAHACFVSSVHDSLGGRKVWAVFDERGADLPGISASVHSTRKSALAAVARWVEDVTGMSEAGV